MFHNSYYHPKNPNELELKNLVNLAVCKIVVLFLIILSIFLLPNPIYAQSNTSSGSSPVVNNKLVILTFGDTLKSQFDIACKPNDTFVNSSESKICGVPATIKANNTATTPVSPAPSSILSLSP